MMNRRRFLEWSGLSVLVATIMKPGQIMAMPRDGAPVGPSAYGRLGIPLQLCERDINTCAVSMSIEIAIDGQRILDAVGYNIPMGWVDRIIPRNREHNAPEIPIRAAFENAPHYWVHSPDIDVYRHYGKVDVTWAKHSEAVQEERAAGWWPTWHERNARRQ